MIPIDATPKPPAPRVLAWLIVGVFAVLVLWMMTGAEHFFVSDAYWSLFWPPMLVLTLLATVKIAPQPMTVKGKPAGPVARWLGMPLLVAGLLSALVGHSLPSLLHLLHHQRFEEQHEIADLSGRRGCRNKVDAAGIPRDFMGEICVSAADYAHMKRRQEITLVGTRSWFGVQVKGYRYESGQPPPPRPLTPEQAQMDEFQRMREEADTFMREHEAEIRRRETQAPMLEGARP